jgi:hypothetical protein
LKDWKGRKERMGRRMNINVNRLCALILLGTLVYNEFLAFYLSYTGWASIPPESCSLLFYADPQLQGYNGEPPGLLGTIQRWDSDRYLRNVYSWISYKYPYSTPVFLGDLLDEGSEATNEEYADYAKRFFSVFPPSSTREGIFTPGDNDVGGEGSDLLTLNKLNRFRKNFGPNKLFYSPCSFLDVFPVSRLTEHGTLNITSKIEHVTRKKTVVVISHVPVLPLDGRFAERIMADLNPDIIFSAHDHRGALFTGSRTSFNKERNMQFFKYKDDITPVKIQTRQSNKDGGIPEMAETMSEIIVPTCSYRMGVQEMGVGLAVFSREGELVYSNLWVPSRFPLLYLYLASVLSILILLLLSRCIGFRKVRRRQPDINISEYELLKLAAHKSWEH